MEKKVALPLSLFNPKHKAFGLNPSLLPILDTLENTNVLRAVLEEIDFLVWYHLEKCYQERIHTTGDVWGADGEGWGGSRLWTGQNPREETRAIYAACNNLEDLGLRNHSEFQAHEDAREESGTHVNYTYKLYKVKFDSAGFGDFISSLTSDNINRRLGILKKDNSNLFAGIS